MWTFCCGDLCDDVRHKDSSTAVETGNLADEGTGIRIDVIMVFVWGK